MPPIKNKVSAARALQRWQERKKREKVPQDSMQELRHFRVVPGKESNQVIIHSVIKFGYLSHFRVEVQYPDGTVRLFSQNEFFPQMMNDFKNTKMIFTRTVFPEPYDRLIKSNNFELYEHYISKTRELEVTFQFDGDETLLETFSSSEDKIKFLIDKYDFFQVGFTERTSVDFGHGMIIRGERYKKLKDIMTCNIDTKYDINIPPREYCIPPNHKKRDQESCTFQNLDSRT